ncbi:MAG TPA: redoxin domain-containing protein [Ferruginibacter sp.]|nr:redoxin domain-containing protein [Ferruginibacter sp.]
MLNKLLVILLCCLVSKVAFAQNPVATIPAFCFSRFDKTVFTNENLSKGRMVFFVFFDTECDHCRHAIQYISQHYNDFSKTAIYLVTVENLNRAIIYLTKNGNNLLAKNNVMLLQDTHSEFIRKFRPRKYPSLFLYSEKKQLLLYDDEPGHLPNFAQRINKH